jgi:hypothetical protein
LGKINFKILLITAQMIGYTISKFLGIVVISGLKRRRRGLQIVLCMAVSEMSLVAFGAAPMGLKPVCLLINGLPLGLIWGLVFSFIEGRRSSDFRATDMCINFIVASGATKAVGKALLNLGVPEMWMPAVTGGIAFPPLILGAYLLELLPDPNEYDIRSRTERAPMTGRDRIKLLRTFWPGIGYMTIFYMLLSVGCETRDNFAPELWVAFSYRAPPTLFTGSEIIIGIVVTIPVLLFMLIKSSIRALVSYHVLLFSGMLPTGTVAALYASSSANGFAFMVLSGIALHFAAGETITFEIME